MIKTNRKEIAEFLGRSYYRPYPELREIMMQCTTNDEAVYLGETAEERRKHWYQYFKAWKNRKVQDAVRARLREKNKNARLARLKLQNIEEIQDHAD